MKIVTGRTVGVSVLAGLIVGALLLGGSAAAGAEPPAAAWFPKAPPLPKPTGQVTRVATVDELFKAVAHAKPGETILVADGHYLMPRCLELPSDDLTLRGESGNRQAVVLDGARSQHGELVAVTGCCGATIADLTIQNIKYNGFKINSDKKAHRVTIYNCVVERNIIINCDTGICLGNSHRARFPIHCTGCVVRNNFLTGGPENGILADYTRDCKILHNTIHNPTSRLKRLIRLVHDNEGLVVANNLLSGPPMRIETESKVQFRGNVEKDLTDWFVNPAEGNLHLKGKAPGVAGAAERLPEIPEDIDRQPRRSPTDVGADEQ